MTRLVNLPLLHVRKLASLKGDDLATAAYLLDAIPVLNSYHLTSQVLREKNDNSAKRLHDAVLQHQIVVSNLLTNYFPNITRKSGSVNKDPSRVIQSRSPCCESRIEQTHDLSNVCSRCGMVLEHTVISMHTPMRNVSYNRDVCPVKSFSYKRLNHLREYLRSLCGNGSMKMPQKAYLVVKKHYDRSTLDRRLIDGERVRAILKQNQLEAHYESRVSIARKINPEYQPFKIDALYEEKLISQFVQLERPFEKVRKKHFPSRKNFLSYPTVLLHLNIINGRQDLNKHIKNLKSSKLAHRQERLYKAVIKELGWAYSGPLTIK